MGHSVGHSVGYAYQWCNTGVMVSISCILPSFEVSGFDADWLVPSLEIEADVGGDDWTRMSSRMKKLENKLIPGKKTEKEGVLIIVHELICLNELYITSYGPTQVPLTVHPMTQQRGGGGGGGVRNSHFFIKRFLANFRRGGEPTAGLSGPSITYLQRAYLVLVLPTYSGPIWSLYYLHTAVLSGPSITHLQRSYLVSEPVSRTALELERREAHKVRPAGKCRT